LREVRISMSGVLISIVEFGGDGGILRGDIHLAMKLVKLGWRSKKDIIGREGVIGGM
jgi:hypothetical protein